MTKIYDYLELGNNPDSPGYFIQWLSAMESVYGYILPGMWWDLGTVESYNAVKSFYELTQ